MLPLLEAWIGRASDKARRRWNYQEQSASASRVNPSNTPQRALTSATPASPERTARALRGRAIALGVVASAHNGIHVKIEVATSSGSSSVPSPRSPTIARPRKRSTTSAMASLESQPAGANGEAQSELTQKH